MANLLDTNIISQCTKPKPDEAVMRWLGSLNSEEMYLSVVSLAEIRYGIERMDRGRKRNDFTLWLEHDLPRMFAGRILPVDERVADEAGRLLSIVHANGKKPDVADALIAATALVNGFKLATLNRKDFEKLPVNLVEY